MNDRALRAALWASGFIIGLGLLCILGQAGVDAYLAIYCASHPGCGVASSATYPACLVLIIIGAGMMMATLLTSRPRSITEPSLRREADLPAHPHVSAAAPPATVTLEISADATGPTTCSLRAQAGG